MIIVYPTNPFPVERWKKDPQARPPRVMSSSAAAHWDFNMNMKNPQKTNDYSPCEFATKEEIEEAAYKLMLGCVLNGSIRPGELIEQAARENWLAQKILRAIGERQ